MTNNEYILATALLKVTGELQIIKNQIHNLNNGRRAGRPPGHTKESLDDVEENLQNILDQEAG